MPTATRLPSATPTLTLEQSLTRVEERYRTLNDLVDQIMQMLRLP
jgi:hypothetical protein